jgi:hypothetical protein
MAEGFKGDFSLPLPAQLRLRVFFSRGANRKQQQQKKKGSVGARESGSAVALFIYLFIY